jgi:hypothetical protein
MKYAPDGRRIFVWRGRDLTEDTNRLTEAVAEACVVKLFEVNGSLVWLRDGRPVAVNRPILLEIITTLIAGVRLVNHRGTDTWEVEFYSIEFPPGADTSKGPNDQVLSNLEEGLIRLVAKGPATPARLTPQQQSEIQARLKTGESYDSIARSYGVDVATIRQLGQINR